jgi:hypothetical protein
MTPEERKLKQIKKERYEIINLLKEKKKRLKELKYEEQTIYGYKKLEKKRGK